MDAPEGEEMESGERRGGFTFSIIPSQTDSPKVEGEMGCEVDYIQRISVNGVPFICWALQF